MSKITALPPNNISWEIRKYEYGSRIKNCRSKKYRSKGGAQYDQQKILSSGATYNHRIKVCLEKPAEDWILLYFFAHMHIL